MIISSICALCSVGYGVFGMILNFNMIKSLKDNGSTDDTVIVPLVRDKNHIQRYEFVTLPENTGFALELEYISTSTAFPIYVGNPYFHVPLGGSNENTWKKEKAFIIGHENKYPIYYTWINEPTCLYVHPCSIEKLCKDIMTDTKHLGYSSYKAKFRAFDNNSYIFKSTIPETTSAFIGFSREKAIETFARSRRLPLLKTSIVIGLFLSWMTIAELKDRRT